MSAGAWLPWTIMAPLISAVLSLWVGRRAVLLLAGLATAATVTATASVAAHVLARGPLSHEVGGWGSPLGIELRADGLAAVMLVLFAAVGPFIVLYALGQFDRRQDLRFVRVCLFAWCALNGLVLSADVFNLYVMLELTTLASVAAMVLRLEHSATQAGLQYLLYALPGSLCYLMGVALLYGAHGTLAMSALGAQVSPGPVAWVALVFMTFGLCLKTPLFPLHAWLPPAYTSSPAPVTALLSGLMSKAPFYILLRLWLEVFPSALGSDARQWVGWLGAAAVLWGSLLALGQKELKCLVAYSSVAQLGYLFLALPMATPGATTGAMYLVLSHAVAKAALFLAVGNVHWAMGVRELSGMQGLAHQLPFSFIAMAIGGTSLMGIPPSGGFIAKFLLLRESLRTGQWWWGVVVLAGGLLAAAYVMRALRSAFLPLPEGTRLRPVPAINELAALALALGALVLGLWPEFPLRFLPGGGR